MITNLYFNSYYAHIDLCTFITALPGRCYFFPDYYFIFCRYIFYRFRKQAPSVFELGYLKNELDSTMYCVSGLFSSSIYPAAGLESLSPFCSMALLARAGGLDLLPWELSHKAWPLLALPLPTLGSPGFGLWQVQPASRVPPLLRIPVALQPEYETGLT